MLRTRWQLGIFLAVWILCASCTIRYSYPPPDSPIGPRIFGDIGYQVEIRGRGFPPRTHERNSLFINAVDRALRDAGYHNPIDLSANGATKNPPKLKLIVDVEVLGIFYDYGHAAAPQEWLTGLSFGIIPSWSTRHELKISFRLVDGETSIRELEYFTKTLWINHLIFFPMAIFQLDVSSEYKHQALQLAAATQYFLGIN